MSNVLDYEKQQQILGLGRLGWTVSRIADVTDVRRETATRYLRGAGLSVRGRGRPGEGAAKPAISGEVSTDPPAKPAISKPEVSTDSPPSRAPSASACAPHREQIEAALKLGRNAMAIWQDLVEEGFTARYASVRRFVRQLRGRTPVEARVVITTAPGEEAQVDYGDGPMVRHPQTAKYRRTRLFVLTLDGTRKAFFADLTAVPLLIIDDLGMRKLPHTAAEDLLEVIMRRYERASTLLTSNRPVDDWGKLLGDTAAVTALLDRLLHHAHVLKCGPRSWRTKIHTDLRTEDATK